MNKNLTSLLILSTVALGLSACMDKPMHDKKPMNHAAPGSYKSTETSTDANGTTTVKESTTDVTIDSDGNRNETITSKTSKDPEGLGNKTSTKTKRTTKEAY